MNTVIYILTNKMRNHKNQWWSSSNNGWTEENI